MDEGGNANDLQLGHGSPNGVLFLRSEYVRSVDFIIQSVAGHLMRTPIKSCVEAKSMPGDIVVDDSGYVGQVAITKIEWLW